jgi:hypothetical protein
MMHISDAHDYGHDPEAEKVAHDFIAEGRRKQIKGVLEQLVDDEFERLEQYADEFISQKAAYRAEKFLERVLKGDNDAAMALLGDKHGNSRYTYADGKPWAQLIHGRLFEAGGVELRRKIVEAHTDLIRNERIADLESVVDGLTQQVKKLASELEQCRMRL